jgi:hypothetical protein
MSMVVISDFNLRRKYIRVYPLFFQTAVRGVFLVSGKRYHYLNVLEFNIRLEPAVAFQKLVYWRYADIIINFIISNKMLTDWVFLSVNQVRVLNI